MEKEKLDEVASRMQKIDMAKAKKSIAEVYDVLTSIEKENGKMPEKIFVDYFLDYFKNIGSATDDTKLLKWLEISGGPYGKTDLIDEDGKVVLTVPPLYSKQKVDDDKLANTKVFDIVATFNNKAATFYAGGIAYLASELSSIPKNITSDVKSDVTAWKHIINHYDNKNDTKIEVPKHKSSVLSAISENELSYD